MFLLDSMLSLEDHIFVEEEERQQPSDFKVFLIFGMRIALGSLMIMKCFMNIVSSSLVIHAFFFQKAFPSAVYKNIVALKKRLS